MSIYPIWFHALRFLMRPAWKKLTIRGAENLTQPSVFVTRHLNNYGPLAVYLFCPFEFHLWSYYAFLEPEAYYQHCSEYTFSQRMGLPMWAAKALAWMLKHPATGMETYAIAAFRSRQSVLRFEEQLRQEGLPSQIISTPRAVSMGCGLSVRLERHLLASALLVYQEHPLSNLIGFYIAQEEGGRIAVRQIRV